MAPVEDDQSLTVGHVTMTLPQWWEAHPDEYAEALKFAESETPTVTRPRPKPERRRLYSRQVRNPPPRRRLTLTVEEAAQLLGISRASAYEAIRRREIPSLRIGKRILIPRSQLERLIDVDSSTAEESQTG